MGCESSTSRGDINSEIALYRETKSQDSQKKINYIHFGDKSFERRAAEQFWNLFKAKPTGTSFENGLKILFDSPNSELYFPKVNECFNTHILFEDFIISVIQIISYRLGVLMKELKVTEAYKLVAKTEVFFNLRRIVLNKESLSVSFFHATLLLNVSRSFIDGDEPLKRGYGILDKSKNAFIVDENTKTDEMQELKRYTNKGIKLLEEIYDTKYFQSKIPKLYEEYGLEYEPEEASHLINLLKSSLKKIIWVGNSPFAGMIGVYFSTYLGQTKIQELSVGKDRENAIVTYIISTKLHEDGHHLIRFKQDNFLSLAQRGESVWEAGYKFEEILFGAAISDYTKIGTAITDLMNWRQPLYDQLLNTGQIDSQKALYPKMNFTLSRICTTLDDFVFK